jgi:hypothetical protein
MQHQYLNPTHGRNDPHLQPEVPRQRRTWPGMEWGVRAPIADEQPLSEAEALVAARLCVATPSQKAKQCN